MITIQKKPYLCAFSKNSIDFTLKSDLQYETSAVFPNLVLKFMEKPITGTTYEIKFTNPENGNVEKINLVASATYANKWQIPDASFTGTLAELRTIVYQKLIAFPVFNAFYTIEVPIIELPGSTPRITITANQAISELVMIWNSNQPSAEIDKYISEANSVAYHQPGVRDGYALKALLFFEKNYNSGIFELITTIDCALDAESISHVDVSKYLDQEIEASWTEYPVPFEKATSYKADNLRRYYLEFFEAFDGNEDLPTLKTEILYVHWGGASMGDQYNNDLVPALINAGQWLTWWPSGKRLLKNQNDWLAWMNGAEEKAISIQGTINVDGEDVIFNLYEITLDPFETVVFNSNFFINGDDVNKITYAVSADNNGETGIKLTIIIDGVTSEFIIPYVTITNEKRRYWKYIDGYYHRIDLTYNIAGFWKLDIIDVNGISSQYIKYSSANLPVFSDWSFVSGIEFSSINTSTYIIEISEKKSFYLLENCFAREILYFNSFGIPESFLLSGEFQQNLTTSQELATRSESFALNNLFPQQYVFDTSSGISYQTETLFLTNEEANRLMPLVNSTITFLKDNNRYLPVIINAGTTGIYKVNSFLQVIKLDLFQANETNRISYFDVMPEFEPVQIGNGISIITMKRNGIAIEAPGTIIAYQNNAIIGTFTYQDNLGYFTGDAITSEGLIHFEWHVSYNGEMHKLTKSINYQWQEKVIETFIIGSGDFSIYLQGLYASQPFRIDWGDGTVEDETLLNSLTEYSHTYAQNGKKVIRIFKPSFFDITALHLYNCANYFDFTDMTYLADLRINSCMTANYLLPALKNLTNLKFDNTSLTGLNIGFKNQIETITLNTTNISSDNFEAFLKEIWLFRKSYENEFDIEITSEVSISTVADSIINGTGIYAGDGLNAYGISIVNI